MEVCGSIFEEIGDIAAIIKVVTKTWFCVEPKVRQDIIFHSQAASYRPLHTVVAHRQVYAVCVGFGLNIPIYLSASRKIDIQSSPLPKGILNVERYSDIVKCLLATDSIILNDGQKFGIQFGIDDTSANRQPVS